MRSPISELKVYLEDAGPIPPRSAGGTRWNYVAYCDAEVDAGLYGYGHTMADACADYLRNVAEEMCNGCVCDEGDACENANDCVLIEPNLSAFIKAHVPLEYQPESSASHEAWIELNPQPDKVVDDDIQF